MVYTTHGNGLFIGLATLYSVVFVIIWVFTVTWDLSAPSMTEEFTSDIFLIGLGLVAVILSIISWQGWARSGNLCCSHSSKQDPPSGTIDDWRLSTHCREHQTMWMVTTKEGLGPSILYLNYFFLHRIRRKLNLKIQTKKVCTFTSLQNQLTSHMEFVIVLLNSDCSICVCDRSKSSSLKGGQPRNVTGVGILDMYRARLYGCFLAIHIDHLHQQMV